MPTIEFFVDIVGVPHTFIKMDNGSGDVNTYGFGPKKGHSPWGPGAVANDSGHEYQFTSGPIEVTVEQYNKMVEYVNDSIENPPYYNVPANIIDPNGMYQCSKWAIEVAKAGGVDWGGFTWNPYGQATYISLVHFGNAIVNFINRVRSIFNAGENAVLQAAGSPIILDLDKDGVETTDLTSGTYFDHDNNGFAEQTGWASSDDGLLVMDKDADGLIEDGTELFGNNTILANGTNASNGFQALAELDTNTDGKIDINDAAYNQLRIWQDIDEDGYTSEGELHSFRLLFSV